MNIVAKKPKGQRIYKSLKFKLELGRNKGKKVKRPYWIEPIGKGWWFDLKSGQWYNGGYDSNRRSVSSYYAMTYDGFKNAYSLKAVIRLVAKWDVPKGTEFTASLPFVGHEFKITKKIIVKW